MILLGQRRQESGLPKEGTCGCAKGLLSRRRKGLGTPLALPCPLSSTRTLPGIPAPLPPGAQPNGAPLVHRSLALSYDRVSPCASAEALLLKLFLACCGTQGPADLSTILRHFRTVAAPYWSSEDKVQARARLAGVFAFSLACTGVSVLFNFLGRDFYNALESEGPPAPPRLCMPGDGFLSAPKEGRIAALALSRTGLSLPMRRGLSLTPHRRGGQ